MRPTEQIRRIHADLAELLGQLPTIEAALANTAPGPRAQQCDRTGGSTVVWCDDHERDVTQCHRHDLACTGVPLVHHADPTGDTATSADPAARQHRQLAKAAASGLAMVRDLQGLVDWSQPIDPAKARRIADAEGVGINTWCQSHQRINVLEPRDPRTAGRTDCAGRLREAIIVCRACRERIDAEAEPGAGMTLSALVPLDELRHHHQHNQWRPLRVDPRRNRV